MAFGLKREELKAWQDKVNAGKIGIITHYWMDARFPDSYTVTKVGCNNISKLIEWGDKYQLDPRWIDNNEKYPHFDLFGEFQLKVLKQEEQWEQINRFNLLRE